MSETSYGTYIGRFEPFHNAHWRTIEYALTQVDHLIVVLGSSNQPRTIKNPFTAGERQLMILNQFSASKDKFPNKEISVIQMKDFLYNDLTWSSTLQVQISQKMQWSAKAKLFGYNKDDSTFYLKLFPHWEFVETNFNIDLDATTIRELLFQNQIERIRKLVPQSTFSFIEEFVGTRDFSNLVEDYLFIKEEQKRWIRSPFPPIFTAVDAVVVCNGHILMIPRQNMPGKNQLQLPGGLVRTNERIQVSAIHHLRTKAGLDVSDADLNLMIKQKNVFDHPKRSLRGRVISNAFYFNIISTDLPKISDSAKWIPLYIVNETESIIYEDHFSIIKYFLG